MIEAASRPATRGFWHTVTRVVMARPVISVALAGAVLLALAVPYLQLQKGTGGPESLPEGNVKTAYTILSTEFSAGMLAPVEIVVDTKGLDPAAVQSGLDRLMAGLRADGAFMPAPQVQWSESHDLAVVTIPLRIPGNSPEAQAAVWRVRDTLVPQALAGTQAPVYVTGSPGDQRGLGAAHPELHADGLRLRAGAQLHPSHARLPFVGGAAQGHPHESALSWPPPTASWWWSSRKGLGHRLFGLQQTSSIESWVPIFLFCILFGLSMDYHVFLLSRIREHFDRTRKNRESVAAGLQSTGRIITGAALIMVVVFSVFASGKLVMIQQLGFGLAVAVFIDATLVRSVLVPAEHGAPRERQLVSAQVAGVAPRAPSRGGSGRGADAHTTPEPARSTLKGAPTGRPVAATTARQWSQPVGSGDGRWCSTVSAGGFVEKRVVSACSS